MLIDKMTEDEIKDLGIDSNEIEEQDEYKEYNDKLIGTPYVFNYAGLQRKVKKGNTEEKKTISNFLPIPVKKVYVDDGIDKEGYLEILPVLNNKINLSKTMVNYRKIEGMAWIYEAELDYQAKIYPPKSNHKEYVNDAIQCLSKDIPNETIYEHTGFRKIKNEYVYLHQGGAIGTDKKFSVDISNIGLERYKFPDKNYNLKECIQTSLSIIDIAKGEITIPTVGLTYLSPLRSIFEENNIPLGFVTWIAGESGSQKSSFAAVLQSHFGDFERDTLPGGFKDTSNSIEKKAFTLKDTLFCIDDYYPSQTLQDSKRMESVAESLFGLYGDRQARSRMKQDGKTVKKGYVARGMCLVTGEAFPTFAESRTARALIIEIARGDINLNELTKIQNQKEKLAFCMKKYIEYIIEKRKAINDSLKDKFIAYRDKANEGLKHGRIPEILASNYIGIELFFEFAKDNGVINEEQMKAYKEYAWEKLIIVGKKQSIRTEEHRIDNMFFRALQELLAAKKVYLKDYNNYLREPDQALSTLIGYHDTKRGRVYLFPEIAFNEVVKFYAVQGIKFPGNSSATWKYLREAGKLFTVEKGRNTTRKKIDGKYITVIEVRYDDIFGEAESGNEENTTILSNNTENHSKNISIDDMELPF